MIPALGSYHPQVVHFAIALLIIGVLFRWIFLTGRMAFTGPAAATLLLLGMVAVLAAVRSGDNAHGAVERVPGARQAVVEHEQWAYRTHYVFAVVAGLEILGLLFSRKGKFKFILVLSGVVGLGGIFCLYQTGERGGSLVYSYAGGVGIRTDNSADVGHLLIAGLYQQAQLDRKLGHPADAHRAIEELQRRFPQDLEIQLLAAESQLLDQKDAAAALAGLERISIPPEDRRMQTRKGFLKVDAQLAAGQENAERATLEQMEKAYPDNQRIKDRLVKLKKQ